MVFRIDSIPKGYFRKDDSYAIANHFETKENIYQYDPTLAYWALITS